MTGSEPVLLSALIASGSSIVLAIISRLRFRCLPDKDGKCVCMSGCSEVPLPGADEEKELVCHRYDLNGRTALVVTARGEK